MTRYWLMKSEPAAYTIEDLGEETTCWEGVRNYQARNLRERCRWGTASCFMLPTPIPRVSPASRRSPAPGIPMPSPGRRVTSTSTRRAQGTSRFSGIRWTSHSLRSSPEIVRLETLKVAKGLEKMMVTQKGSRLSVQPVTKSEYDIVARLGRRIHRGAKPTSPGSLRTRRCPACRRFGATGSVAFVSVL